MEAVFPKHFAHLACNIYNTLIAVKCTLRIIIKKEFEFERNIQYIITKLYSVLNHGAINDFAIHLIFFVFLQ